MNKKSDAEARLVDLWQSVETFQNRFSRFLDTSELSAINNNAGKWVRVSDECEQLLVLCNSFMKLSQGLFNPFVLPELQNAGYLRSLSGGTAPDYRDRKMTNNTAIEMRDNKVRIPKNTAIDLGGIGKGYLADLLAAQLEEQNVDNYCLSIGGDMIVSGQDQEGPWQIPVQAGWHRLEDAAVYGSSLKKFAVATSGINRNVKARVQAHLIDPRTGRLTDSQYRCVTVAANSAVSADVLASCIVLGGSDYARQLHQQQLVEAVYMQYDDEGNWGVKTIGKGFKKIHETVGANKSQAQPAHA